MKLGIALDGALCDKQTLFEEWHHRLGDDRFLQDAAFWAALQPYEDIKLLADIASEFDLYVFAERPKSLFLPTRAWIRKNSGVVLNKDRLIMQALKRYDCRMLGITKFIDGSSEAIENLKTEQVAPIDGYLIDREAGETLADVMDRIR